MAGPWLLGLLKHIRRPRSWYRFCSVNGNAYGDVLIGSPAPENSANPSDDVKEEGTASPNGLVPACRSAEAEELQAHVSQKLVRVPSTGKHGISYGGVVSASLSERPKHFFFVVINLVCFARSP